MRTSKYSSLFKIILALLLIITLFSSVKTSEYEKKYLYLKEQGKYREAVKIIRNWTLKLKDPALIEANIFRIYEMIIYPELIKPGIYALTSIKKNKAISGNGFFLSRINIFLGLLYLKEGRLSDTEKIVNSMGFLDFNITGPFSSRSVEEFQKQNGPESVYNRDKYYKGKFNRVTWFKTKKNRTGETAIENLHSETKDSLFYFYREIFIPIDGEYYFLIGKTGFTDIWLDGEIIFSNRIKHGFQYDQYYIKVFLPEGKHRILIKTGDFKKSIKLSFRVSDSLGKGISNTVLYKKSNFKEKGKLIKSSLFHSITNLTVSKNIDEKKSFILGYLIYMSNLGKDDNSLIIKYFSGINRNSYLNTTAFYYMGKSNNELEKKEQYFKESLDYNNNNIESLIEIIKIKLKYNFIFDAFLLIKKIKNINFRSHYYQLSLAKFFSKKKWDIETAKSAAKLKKSDYPSIGYFILAKKNLIEKKFINGVGNLTYLVNIDRYNITYIDLLLKCYIKTGMYKKAINLLTNTVALFPNNIQLRLLLAEVVGKEKGLPNSIPYISSALKISPENWQSQYMLGITYHKLGKTKIALYYLKLALRNNPYNYSLKRYLKIIH